MAKEDNHQSSIPKETIDFLIDPIRRFIHIESSSGVMLIMATLLALILANSPFSDSFVAFWKTKIGFSIGTFEMKHSLQHWINDFLMAIFFFVIGLEVKRELVMGELSNLKNAILPLFAALGGMVGPSMIYLSMQWGAPGENGWGIPMATDIAFVIGCLTLLGKRIPNALRIMVISLAIADDIGAILVIAIGYTDTINFSMLLIAFTAITILLIFMKLGVQNVAVYIVISLIVWFGFHESGVHATIAGVILGLLTPTRSWINESRFDKIIKNALHFMQGEGWSRSSIHYNKIRELERATRKTVSPLKRFENDLHPWVGFVIMPIFALANAGVVFNSELLTHPVAFAIVFGLFIGKPLGIFIFSWIAVKVKIAQLPEGVGWPAIIGMGTLAGIGFTMALFIAGLALHDELMDAAKVGILIGSALSALLGMSLLLLIFKK